MAHDLAIAGRTEEGRANLDKWGYTVHDGFLSASELAELRGRLDEQAELERDAGVATLSGSGHAAGDRYVGAPRAGERIGYQMVSHLVNKGRVFLDLVHKHVIHDYAAHLFRGLVLGEPDVAQPGRIHLRQGPGVDRMRVGAALHQAAGLLPRDCPR